MYKLKNKQLIHLTKGKHHDGGGLYIRITRQGKGLWTYRFRLNKKSHEMSLGTFPEVKLSEAREKLAEQKRLRLKDINPLHEKRKHEILKEQQNKKFSEIADLYITTKKKDEWTNPKSEQQWRSTIETYARPVLDKKPFIDINHDDILEVLFPIWSTKTETARRLQQRLFRIISFAKIKKWYDKENPASWQEHLSHVLPDPYKIQRVKHHAHLKHNEIKVFYNRLCKLELFSAYALRMVILTVTRTSEVLKSKFEEFDLENRIWTIPSQNMKSRKEHKIPLSNEVIKIINFMRRKHNHPFVFPNTYLSKPLSNGAMLNLLKTKFSELKITVHGFRSTFRTWAEEENKYQHYVIKFSQAHQLPNKIEKAYLRSDLFHQRITIMNDWENYLLSDIA